MPTQNHPRAIGSIDKNMSGPTACFFPEPFLVFVSQMADSNSQKKEALHFGTTSQDMSEESGVQTQNAAVTADTAVTPTGVQTNAAAAVTEMVFIPLSSSAESSHTQASRRQQNKQLSVINAAQPTVVPSNGASNDGQTIDVEQSQEPEKHHSRKVPKRELPKRRRNKPDRFVSKEAIEDDASDDDQEEEGEEEEDDEDEDEESEQCSADDDESDESFVVGDNDSDIEYDSNATESVDDDDDTSVGSHRCGDKRRDRPAQPEDPPIDSPVFERVVQQTMQLVTDVFRRIGGPETRHPKRRKLRKTGDKAAAPDVAEDGSNL